MTVAINLFAGPGAGKSTTAAGVFRLLKLAGKNVELVTEYAKDLTWADRRKTLDDQLYIFAKQHHRMAMCADQVDFIVTDSPLLLSSVYGTGQSQTFHDLVLERFRAFDNRNFFINRTKPYQPVGRSQTEAEARALDAAVKSTLRRAGECVWEIQGDVDAAERIAERVL